MHSGRRIACSAGAVEHQQAARRRARQSGRRGEGADIRSASAIEHDAAGALYGFMKSKGGLCSPPVRHRFMYVHFVAIQLEIELLSVTVMALALVWLEGRPVFIKK